MERGESSDCSDEAADGRREADTREGLARRDHGRRQAFEATQPLREARCNIWEGPEPSTKVQPAKKRRKETAGLRRELKWKWKIPVVGHQEGSDTEKKSDTRGTDGPCETLRGRAQMEEQRMKREKEQGREREEITKETCSQRATYAAIGINRKATEGSPDLTQ